MPRRVSGRWNRSYTRQHLAPLEEAPVRLVGRRLLAALLEHELLLALGTLRHRGIVEPVLRLVLVHDEFGVGEVLLAGCEVGKARRLIRMHVGQQDRIDPLGRDAGGLQVADLKRRVRPARVCPSYAIRTH